MDLRTTDHEVALLRSHVAERMAAGHPRPTLHDFLWRIRTGRDPKAWQPREHPVPCRVCRTPTWHETAECWQHHAAYGLDPVHGPVVVVAEDMP